MITDPIGSWVPGSDSKPKMFFGDFKPEGNNTAHMQMQKHLPKKHKCKIICAGSLRTDKDSGRQELRWNSLYNNEDFRLFMNREAEERDKDDPSFDMDAQVHAMVFGMDADVYAEFEKAKR